MRTGRRGAGPLHNRRVSEWCIRSISDVPSVSRAPSDTRGYHHDRVEGVQAPADIDGSGMHSEDTSLIACAATGFASPCRDRPSRTSLYRTVTGPRALRERETHRLCEAALTPLRNRRYQLEIRGHPDERKPGFNFDNIRATASSS